MPSSHQITVLTLAARTAAVSSEPFAPGPSGAVNFVIDISSNTAVAALTVSFEGYDSTSGEWYTLLTTSALSTEATTSYAVGPNVAAVTNVSATRVVPVPFRASVAVADGKTCTYSIGAQSV